MSADQPVPVGTMCAMFGLNPNTIRTWERRYGFPSPQRSDGGHRTYSPADIALIASIVRLMDSGASPAEAIGQGKAAGAAKAAKKVKPKTAAVRLDEEIDRALATHDPARLKKHLRLALKQKGYRAFMEETGFPLLVRVGHAWERTGKGVAAEHMATLAISAVVLEQSHHVEADSGAPVVTFACVPDEAHHLPLLHLANIVVEERVARPIVLAAGLPVSEILEASATAKSRLILLSATMAPLAGNTREWMKELMAAGWADKIVLAGPGFMRTRVYHDYPVRAAAGGFQETLDLLKTMLQ